MADREQGAWVLVVMVEVVTLGLCALVRCVVGRVRAPPSQSRLVVLLRHRLQQRMSACAWAAWSMLQARGADGRGAGGGSTGPAL